MKKYIGLAIILIGAVIMVWLLIRQQSNDLSVYTVKREDLVDTIQVNANYNAASQTQVFSPTNGIITQLFVANNQSVKKGDPLFHVESTATESEKKAAYAGYLAAKTALDADQALAYTLQSTMFSQWKTFYDLATNNTYQNSDNSPNETNRALPEFHEAKDDWLAAEANYKNQQGVIAKDQAALSSARLTYEQTQSVTVNAPASGQVVNLLVNVGDQVTVQSAAASATSVSSQSITASRPVAVIATFTQPSLIAAVNEVNVPRIHPGQPTKIVFDALPDQTFAGTVTVIDTVGNKSQGDVEYGVKVIMQGNSAQLKPSMSATITIETLRKNQVLTLPNSAIVSKNGINYVKKAGVGKDQLTKIELGVKGFVKSEVVAGVSAGDRIVAQ
ncbi:efflux RND transporter periplasmic adaptor subunit [Patescibacteria group bacterium]|nr:efflux RND transporter periplasmic adaptor subunit [Patescibacteria group bacterium]MCL5091516.1 efflux RND transporter periplasmic adaptor subunit [Patescibacteria group bacterium]